MLQCIKEVERGVNVNSFFSDDYYKCIFENSLDAIMITKPDGQIAKANPAACEMLGWTTEELSRVGRDGVIDLEDPKLKETLELRKKNGRVRAELYFLRKDGTKFLVDLTSSLFRTKEGEMWASIIMRDMTKVKEAEKILMDDKAVSEKLAAYDCLTGVLNRRGFMKRLGQEIEKAKRERQVLGLIMTDVDLLKTVNDHHGHLAGDQVLSSFAAVLQENLRLYDVLGRLGGDEFIVVLPDTRDEKTKEIAERLREKVEKMEVQYEGSTIKITASFGVKMYRPETEMSIDQLISRADEYLYRAKAVRNKVYKG